jgi:hypothetical protein
MIVAFLARIITFTCDGAMASTFEDDGLGETPIQLMDASSVSTIDDCSNNERRYHALYRFKRKLTNGLSGSTKHSNLTGSRRQSSHCNFSKGANVPTIAQAWGHVTRSIPRFPGGD